MFWLVQRESQSHEAERTRFSSRRPGRLTTPLLRVYVDKRTNIYEGKREETAVGRRRVERTLSNDISLIISSRRFPRPAHSPKLRSSLIMSINITLSSGGLRTRETEKEKRPHAAQLLVLLYEPTIIRKVKPRKRKRTNQRELCYYGQTKSAIEKKTERASCSIRAARAKLPYFLPLHSNGKLF